MSNTSKSYFPSLSGIRFICALGVVLHHTLYYFNPNSWLSTLQLGNGAVTLFFVLSGFVLYHRYAQDEKFNVIHYYKSRFIRLFPLYWLSLLLFFILIGSSHFWMPNPTPVETLITIIGIQSFIPYPRYYFAVNPVGWFISAEIFLSFLFPFLLYSCQNRIKFVGFFVGKKGITILSLIAYVILVLVCFAVLGENEQNNNFIQNNTIVSNAFLRFNPLSRLFQFVFGMILADFVHSSLWDKIKNSRIFSANSLWILIGFGLLYYIKFNFYWLHNVSSTLQSVYNLTFIQLVNTLAALLVILCCVVNKGYICEIFSTKLCRDLGKISYSVFIFHPILGVYLFRDKEYNALSMDLKVLIYFSILIAVSYCLYWVFEYKLIQFFKNKE